MKQRHQVALRGAHPRAAELEQVGTPGVDHAAVELAGEPLPLGRGAPRSDDENLLVLVARPLAERRQQRARVRRFADRRHDDRDEGLRRRDPRRPGPGPCPSGASSGVPA